MLNEESIVLPCPYCRKEIFRPIDWFKQAYATCPACGGGLSAGQFAAVIDNLEQALESEIEEMVQGKRDSGCGCGKSCC